MGSVLIIPTLEQLLVEKTMNETEFLEAELKTMQNILSGWKELKAQFPERADFYNKRIEHREIMIEKVKKKLTARGVYLGCEKRQ